jgi:hypothetical protein
MPPFIVRPKEKSEDPNDYSGCNSTPWHPKLTVLNLVIDPLKTETISIKGYEYHSAQSSYQLHDLTYQSFCKTHVSHGNNTLSSIAEINFRGLDAFKHLGNRVSSWLYSQLLAAIFKIVTPNYSSNEESNTTCHYNYSDNSYLLQQSIRLMQHTILVAIRPTNCYQL